MYLNKTDPYIAPLPYITIITFLYFQVDKAVGTNHVQSQSVDLGTCHLLISQSLITVDQIELYLASGWSSLLDRTIMVSSLPMWHQQDYGSGVLVLQSGKSLCLFHVDRHCLLNLNEMNEKHAISPLCKIIIGCVLYILGSNSQNTHMLIWNKNWIVSSHLEINANRIDNYEACVEIPWGASHASVSCFHHPPITWTSAGVSLYIHIYVTEFRPSSSRNGPERRKSRNIFPKSRKK